MRLRNILILVCAVVAAYFVFDSLSQPNTGTLPGNFTETAMYRNPNNTGPIVRIFSVQVDDTLWEEMEQYGDMMPYTKYGTTTVYFFKSGQPAPEELLPDAPHFSEQFNANCLGKYQKDAMGSKTMVKYPFANN